MSRPAWDDGAIWRATERAHGFLRMGWLSLVVGIGLVAVAVAAGEGDAAGAAAVLVAVGVGLLFTGSVDVAIGEHGVQSRSSLLRRPVICIPLERIASAEVVTLYPGQWGGWGYRASIRLKGRGWVMRRGPALQLRLPDGRIFVVTLTEPHDAVAAVERLLTAR